MKYCRVQPLAAHFPAPGHQKTPNVSRACLKNALTFGVSLHNISLFAFMLMHHISAKNLHLLSSRLYCRLWNHTISATLPLHCVHWREKRVADFTACREFHPAPKICYFVYVIKYSTKMAGNQGFFSIF